MVDNYTTWAKDYDKSLCEGRYNGPSICAEEVAARFPSDQRATVKVMDLAAGTGRVGLELHKRGFRNIDALEPSEGMLEVLKETEVYDKSFMEFVGIGQNTVTDGYYDAVVLSGGMGEGHIPVAGIDDMVRMTKSGGLVIIVMRKEYLEYVEEYKGKLEPYMEELEKLKKWQKIGRREVEGYSFGKTGLVFTYKVL
ncbi:unnamed protein product [Meganyctiphanes norvegica]|uniref:Methyltransferase domain-containing protein n=1 Tax=Meganyctiphanes norvegica TaxID=48144 RepID=A0AAV2RPT5_MEGNR